jgi:hypothetical protein
MQKQAILSADVSYTVSEKRTWVYRPMSRLPQLSRFCISTIIHHRGYTTVN